MQRVLIAVIWFVSLVPVWGGAILGKNGTITIGVVTEEGGKIVLQTEYGKARYKPEHIAWYTTDARVTSRLLGAALALQQKNHLVARALLEASIAEEPETRARAQEVLAALKKEMKPQAPALPPPPSGEAKSLPPLTTSKEKPKTDKIVAEIKDDLVRPGEAGLVTVPADQVKPAEMYALYYSAHWCGPCRAFTPKLVAFYNEMHAKHEGRFEVIFMSFDRNEEAMAGYMKEAKMPWPALQFAKVRKSSLAKYAGKGIPCLVLIDGQGEVLADTFDGTKYLGANVVLENLRERLKANDK